VGRRIPAAAGLCRLEPLESRRSAEREVELVVVHHVEDEHVVTATAEQAQPAEQTGPVDQQIGPAHQLADILHAAAPQNLL